MKRFVSAVFASALICGGIAVSTPAAAAENNWSNWRGPNYNGSVEGVDPPTEWSGTKNVKWKVKVPGKASSSPIVHDGQIILLSAVETGEKSSGGSPLAFTVFSFNLADGKERWHTVAAKAVPHEAGHQTNTQASSSAVTDGKFIYASFGSRGIYCFDMKGKEIWKKDLGKMQTRNAFGEGASPALVKDRLIVQWDHEAGSKIYALSTADGKILWEKPREESTTWATPLAAEYNGKTQIITNAKIVRSYDLETGDLLWSCGGQVANPIPSPVRMDDFVVCMTGYQGNAIYAMPLDAKGNISNSDKILWKNGDAAPYVASPTLYKGQLYFIKERNGVLSSIEARTGKVLIPPTRISDVKDVYASLVAGGDKIYLTGRDGTTVVFAHGSTLEKLAVNHLDEPVDASMAILGNRILIRGAEHLYLIGK